jgi:hypothetical protein
MRAHAHSGDVVIWYSYLWDREGLMRLLTCTTEVMKKRTNPSLPQRTFREGLVGRREVGAYIGLYSSHARVALLPHQPPSIDQYTWNRYRVQDSVAKVWINYPIAISRLYCYI